MAAVKGIPYNCDGNAPRGGATPAIAARRQGGPPFSAGKQVDHPPETAPRCNLFGNWNFLKEHGIPLRNKNILKDCKMLKSIGYTTFWSLGKSYSKYLIKPVVYGDFWGPFRHMAPKSIKKALGFSVKVEVVLRLRKTSKKHWPHNVLELPKKLFEIPYKTCRLWRLLGPFSQNGSKKYQKSIRIFTKRHRPFCLVGKPYKTCRK